MSRRKFLWRRPISPIRYFGPSASPASDQPGWIQPIRSLCHDRVRWCCSNLTTPWPPVLAIVNRWLRGSFSPWRAFICHDFPVDRSALLSVLADVFFCSCLVPGETLYNWLAISALSLARLRCFHPAIPPQAGARMADAHQC